VGGKKDFYLNAANVSLNEILPAGKGNSRDFLGLFFLKSRWLGKGKREGKTLDQLKNKKNREGPWQKSTLTAGEGKSPKKHAQGGGNTARRGQGLGGVARKKNQTNKPIKTLGGETCSVFEGDKNIWLQKEKR